MRNSELSMTRAGAAAAGVELMTISRVAGDCDAARSVILPSQPSQHRSRVREEVDTCTSPLFC